MPTNPLIQQRLQKVHTTLLLSKIIIQFKWMQQQAVGNIGYFRIQGQLSNGEQLMFMERFRQQKESLEIEKYSFHWQTAEGLLVRRWDNAPHHREIATFPDHLHEGSEQNVLAHPPTDFFAILGAIEKLVFSAPSHHHG